MKYLYPLIAVHRNGGTILLYNEDAVANFIAKYGRFTDNHVDYYCDPSDYYFTRRVSNGWIMRDDRGQVVKFEDIKPSYKPSAYLTKRRAIVKAAIEKGLPIPGTGGWKKIWKMNHQAKKNSGARKRNRNRSLCEEHFKEYGVKNPYGKVRRWED